jgi:hypothetical protein
MPREVIREFLRPQDRLDLNFAESFATHCVALYTPTGEIKIEPIERANNIVLEWRQHPAPPGAAVTFNIYLLSAGRTREALDDPHMIARLESCAPMLLAVESEEDADLVAEELRGHLARLHATGAGTEGLSAMTTVEIFKPGRHQAMSWLE